MRRLSYALLALALTGCMGTAAAEPPPWAHNPTKTPSPTATASPTPPPTPEPPPLFGANANRAYTDYGPLHHQRVFVGGATLPSWTANAALASGVPALVSFKIPPAQVITGTYDAAFRSWLTAKPAGYRVWLTNFHEPEDDIARGDFTAAAWRAAIAHLWAVSQEPGVYRADTEWTVVLMDWTVDANSGRNWRTYYPDDDGDPTNGSPYFGTVTWDVYEFDEEVDPYDPDPNETTMAEHLYAPGRARNIFTLHDVTHDRIAVGELGYDDAATRPAFLANFGTWARANQLVFADYFDYDGTTGDHRLHDAASRAAWDAVLDGTG